VQVRYKQAAFGMLWALAQPVATLVVFTVLFDRLARIPSDNVPYVPFAFVGTIFWALFSGGLDAATTSLVANSSLVTKVYFPRAAAPLASVLPRLVDFGVSVVLLVPLVVVLHRAPGVQALLVPLLAAWVVVLAFSFGLTLATLQVRYRDAHHGLALIVQMWLYASPVAYPSSVVDGGWRWLYALNPMAGVLDTARWALLSAPAPGPYLLVSIATSVLALVVGVRVFAANERRFADVI